MAGPIGRVGLSVCSAWFLLPGLLLFPWAMAGRPPAHWVVSWGTSASPPPEAARLRAQGLEFNHETLREIVHLSLGGAAVRVRFSNRFGSQSLEIGSARLAVRATDSSIQMASDHPLTFDGKPATIIPPNAWVTSDPVELAVSAGSDLAISIFIPHLTAASAIHYLAQQTSYVGEGDQTAASAMAEARPITSWIFLAGVDVNAAPAAAAIAVFGDSRVDGDGSTLDANKRLPDALSKRLSQQGLRFGVLNAGIIGNRILHDAPRTAVELGVNGLSRFTHDALDAPGVKYVIVLEGLVDIGLPGTEFASASEEVTLEDLIGAMKQLIAQAHDRGMKVFGATQTPFSGALTIPGMFNAEKEAERKALNQWMRTSHAFDAVLDFDSIVRDPAKPEQIRPAWDSGDHIHPNDLGYQAMADSIDLVLFQ